MSVQKVAVNPRLYEPDPPPPEYSPEYPGQESIYCQAYQFQNDPDAPLTVEALVLVPGAKAYIKNEDVPGMSYAEVCLLVSTLENLHIANTLIAWRKIQTTRMIINRLERGKLDLESLSGRLVA